MKPLNFSTEWMPRDVSEVVATSISATSKGYYNWLFVAVESVSDVSVCWAEGF